MPGRGSMEIDVVMAGDPGMAAVIADIRAQGRQPVELPPWDLRVLVPYMVDEIIRRAEIEGPITVLRFHGSAAMDGGAVLNSQTVLVFGGDLALLRPHFAPGAHGELHGSRAGSGPWARIFLLNLAEAWGVPVSAGSRTQRSGHGRTFRFEGPVYTVYPNGRVTRTPPMRH